MAVRPMNTDLPMANPVIARREERRAPLESSLAAATGITTGVAISAVFWVVVICAVRAAMN
ncbi:hypothetical protein EBE87_24725 [Pseudoroseomonas wenyumeiae]|uniref:Uncharacterized protein n=2 Tax=Teichococcus wenyumeiae TaxID=2478470 RepID=A0A3A9J576_9PROT|nr:hypothetical protein D6Z83_20225 [Pseudoroseomonas wenyumeiae]RMI16926.1 hypothetical protein EBE87_24725 [Pseudoroseomonas wenyumeiae]